MNPVPFSEKSPSVFDSQRVKNPETFTMVVSCLSGLSRYMDAVTGAVLGGKIPIDNCAMLVQEAVALYTSLRLELLKNLKRKTDIKSFDTHMHTISEDADLLKLTLVLDQANIVVSTFLATAMLEAIEKNTEAKKENSLDNSSSGFYL